jgi:hypothetical protein
MNYERCIRINLKDSWILLTEEEAIEMRDLLEKSHPRLVGVPETVPFEQGMDALATSGGDHIIVK